jgi:hypothetical protein
LNRGGKTADDEVYLLFFDEFQRPRRGFAGIELSSRTTSSGLRPLSHLLWPRETGWPAVP